MAGVGKVTAIITSGKVMFSSATVS